MTFAGIIYACWAVENATAILKTPGTLWRKRRSCQTAVWNREWNWESMSRNNIEQIRATTCQEGGSQEMQTNHPQAVHCNRCWPTALQHALAPQKFTHTQITNCPHQHRSRGIQSPAAKAALRAGMYETASASKPPIYQQLSELLAMNLLPS